MSDKFDMQKAHAICAIMAEQENQFQPDKAANIEVAANMLPAALDRIEELEKALVEERAQKIYPFSMPRWENVPEDDCVTDHPLFGKANQTGKKTYRWHAREQLEKEGIL